MDDTNGSSDQPSDEPQNNQPSVGSGKENEVLTAAKSRAMDALVPLLDNIQDIDPERKFDICINAMRYTDNKALAEPALEAALSIAEAGPKAEALVELINEIDYLLKS